MLFFKRRPLLLLVIVGLLAEVFILAVYFGLIGRAEVLKTNDGAGSGAATEATVASLPRYAGVDTAAMQLKTRYLHEAVSACSPFYLVWTGPSEEFGATQRAVLNSIAFQLPCAPIVVLSIVSLDIDLHGAVVQLLDDMYLAQLSAGVPAAEAWFARLDEWRKLPHFHVHLADFVRYAILHFKGGSVGDFNTIYLRTFGSLSNALGMTAAPDCSWSSCLDQPYVSMHTFINWKAENAVMRCALDAFQDSTYLPSCTDCMGARLLTRCLLAADPAHVTVLPQHYLDPIPWFDYYRYAKRNPEARPPMVSKLLEAYAVYLHDPALEIDVHSVIGRVLALFSPETATREPFLVLRHQFWITDELKRLDGLRFSSVTHEATARVVLTADAACLLAPSSPWPPVSRVELAGSTADINNELQHIAVVVTTAPVVNVSLSWILPHASGTASLTVSDMQQLVTVITKTSTQGEALRQLVQGVRSFYPSVSILVAAENGPTSTSASVITLTPQSIPLHFDAGEGVAFNALMDRVRTPYFFLADEDYAFDFLGTNLEYLIQVASQSSADFVGVRSPDDERIYGYELDGRMYAYVNLSISLSALPLWKRPAVHGFPDCTEIGFLHGAFLGRTASALRLKWDTQMKLGAREQFFYRAQHGGYTIASCTSLWIHHKQDTHSALETLLSPQRRRKHTFLRLMLRKFQHKYFYAYGHLIVDDLGSDPLQLCAPGFTGDACSICASGFKGDYCNECDATHYGPLCLPCKCVRGRCVGGMKSEGCVCDAEAMGMHCDKQMSALSGIPHFCDKVSKGSAGWAPVGDGFKCVEDTDPKGNEAHVPQVMQSRNGGGLTYTYFALQNEPKALAVSVWSKAVLAGNGPSFAYSLDVDVFFMDETETHGLHAPFSAGTHGWEEKRVVIEADKAIASLRLRVLFQEHTGLVRFALPSVLEQVGRLEPLRE